MAPLIRITEITDTPYRLALLCAVEFHCTSSCGNVLFICVPFSASSHWSLNTRCLKFELYKNFVVIFSFEYHPATCLLTLI